jgi:hypothetical protein
MERYREPDGDVARPPYKFDYCIIGGRYDGLITGKEQHYNLSPDEFEKRYGVDVITPEANRCGVLDLPADIVPDAIVTPDGTWHDDLGQPWNDWEREARRILHQHSTHQAVALDCHC